MKVPVSCFHRGKILSEGETRDARDNCPLCGDSSSRPAAVPIQTQPPIDLLQCHHCGGLSASRMPLQSVLDDFYSRYYEKSRNAHITCHSHHRFAHHILRGMRVEALTERKAIAILDFGGGDGAVSIEIGSRLPASQVKIIVVDYESRSPRFENKVSIEWHPNLSDVHGLYDIVLASAVLEHIPELRPILKALFDLLAPGGCFYARTPYVSPLMRLFPGIDFTYPAHVHDLGPQFWNRVAASYNLNAVPLLSRPSLVETEFGKSFFRTLMAHILKFPSKMETTLFPDHVDPWWKLVGGWEVILQKNDSSPDSVAS